MVNTLRNLLPIMLWCAAGWLHAQDLTLAPKWKRDDLRTMYVSHTQTFQDPEGNDTTITYRTSSKVKVYDLSPEKALISIDHENVLFPLIRAYFPGMLPTELEPYKRMIIRYEVDRTSGESRLLNAADLQQFAQRPAEIAVRVVRREDANTAAMLEQQLAPLVARFTDQEMITQYFDQWFGFLTVAFGKPLQRGNPIEMEIVQADPFHAGDSIAVNTSIELKDHSSDKATVHVTRNLGDRMLAAGGSGKGKAVRANDAVHLTGWQQERTVVLDTKTTWPTNANMITRVSLSDGNKATEEITIDIR